jgi:putative toxin-antitoxin system antitoxin component (TIGR02293 family)
MGNSRSTRRPAKPATKKSLSLPRAPDSAVAPAARTRASKTAKKRSDAPVKPVVRRRLLGSATLRIFGVDLPLASTTQRVDLIRAGVPAIVIEEIGGRLSMPKRRLYESLNFPRATIDRKIKEGGKLSPEQSERVLGLQKLVQEVSRMVDESGAAAGFDAPAWVGRFLDAPWAVLGGRRPADYMDTIEGQQLVINLLRRVQAGIPT